MPIAYVSEKQNGTLELLFAIQSSILEIRELCKKKTPYAARIGVHKASTGFKNEKRSSSIYISVPLCAHTPRKYLDQPQGLNQLRGHGLNVLNLLCELESERKKIIFLVFQQRLITAKYLDLFALDLRY